MTYYKCHHTVFTEQNCEYAQFKIGEMYYNGEGVPQDYAEAIKWYRKAAEDNYAHGYASDALFYLSDMYHRGVGVPKDYVQAYMWLAIDQLRTGTGHITDQNDNDWFSKFAAKMTPMQIAEAKRLAKEWLRAMLTRLFQLIQGGVSGGNAT